MNKFLYPATLAVLLMLTLTACGNGNSATPPAPEPTPLNETALTSTIIETAITAEQAAELEPVGRSFDPADINIGVLRGPTGLGMLGVMDIDNPYYHISLMGAPDEIVPQLVQGNLDLAAVPANLASVLYNNTNGAIQVLAINTLGVLHIIDTTDSIESIADLAGQTVFLSGLGGVPEFALNHVLRQHGLEPGQDVTLDFRSEHTEISALLQAGYAQIALLPEPFATTTTLNVDNARFAVDLSQAWHAVEPNSNLVMGVLVGRRDFVEANPDATLAFLLDYSDSIALTLSDLPHVAELAVYHGIIPNPNVAAQAIPRSNIVFIEGQQMADYLTGFLSVLYEQAPASIGGNLPSAAFFFDRP